MKYLLKFVNLLIGCLNEMLAFLYDTASYLEDRVALKSQGGEAGAKRLHP